MNFYQNLRTVLSPDTEEQEREKRRERLLIAGLKERPELPPDGNHADRIDAENIIINAFEKKYGKRSKQAREIREACQRGEPPPSAIERVVSFFSSLTNTIGTFVIAIWLGTVFVRSELYQDEVRDLLRGYFRWDRFGELYWLDETFPPLLVAIAVSIWTIREYACGRPKIAAVVTLMGIVAAKMLS